jgi:hypothetical protein
MHISYAIHIAVHTTNNIQIFNSAPSSKPELGVEGGRTRARPVWRIPHLARQRAHRLPEHTMACTYPCTHSVRACAHALMHTHAHMHTDQPLLVVLRRHALVTHLPTLSLAHFLTHSPRFAARRHTTDREACLKESRLLRQLDHPHVIKCHAVFMHFDEINIVLECAALPPSSSFFPACPHRLSQGSQCATEK